MDRTTRDDDKVNFKSIINHLAPFFFTVISIFYVIISMLNNSLVDRFLFHGHLIETSVSTSMPIFVLAIIAFPSLTILSLIDDIHSRKLTVKTIDEH